MNLPKAIVNLRKKESEAAAKENLVTIVEDQPMSLAQVAEKISDVEYEDEYQNDDDLVVGASALVETEIKEEYKPQEVRDYSINLWNGSPGLSQWGYDDKYNET